MMPLSLAAACLLLVFGIATAIGEFTWKETTKAATPSPAVSCALHNGVNDVAVDRYGSVAAFTCRDGSFFKVSY